MLAGGLGLVGAQWWEAAVTVPAATAADGAAVAVVGPHEGRHAAAAVPLPVSPVGSGAQAGAAPSGDDLEIPKDGLQVCGVGHVPAAELRRWRAEPAWGEVQAERLSQEMAQVGKQALAKIAARLAAGNDRQQVAARLLMQDRDGAALLAERSRDAQAYQMALMACGGPGGDTANCARLTPQRWAALDPSDARPWLRLMDAARQRKDAAGVDAALAEAAARPRFSRVHGLLAAEVVAVADAVPDLGGVGHALMAVLGMDLAMTGFDMALPVRVCKGGALADATRLAHCRAFARQALAGATDLLEASVAQTLADRVGVPRDQQPLDAATIKAARERLGDLTIAAVGMDCAAMQRTTQFARDVASRGELAFALSLVPAKAASR